MSELSEVEPPIEWGHVGDDSTVNVGPDYENVNFPVTQAENLTAAEISQSKLVKKPKPSPKPNYVAVKVAEWNLQQRINSNESTSKPLPTKTVQPGAAGLVPPRPPVMYKSSKSASIDLDRNDSSQFPTDPPLYDTAVQVQLDVLQRISEGMASADVPGISNSTSATTDSPDSKTMPVYATPIKSVDEEPIYDDAIAVGSSSDDEPLYDEAIIVHADRLRMMDNTMVDEEEEPLYAEPDDFVHDRSDTCQNVRYSYDDSLLYEVVEPIEAISCREEEPLSTTL